MGGGRLFRDFMMKQGAMAIGLNKELASRDALVQEIRDYLGKRVLA